MSVDRTVLLTGGAGFIGSAVGLELARRGWQILSLDLGPLERVPQQSGWRHAVGDVRDADMVSRLAGECSHVLHLAAIAEVDAYMERPVDVLDTNIGGTRNVVSAAAEAGLPVLFASSSEIYGRNTEVLSELEASVLGPTTTRRWCYAVSKLAGEHYARGLTDGKVPLGIVRYFNVYGPLLDRPGSGRVISQFLGMIQRGEPLLLVDGGEAVRTFCWVDDAARATVDVFESLDSGEPVVVNIGSEEALTIRELAQMMVRLADHAPGTKDISALERFGPGYEDIPLRRPSLGALRARIGWVPTSSVSDGLRATMAHWGLLA